MLCLAAGGGGLVAVLVLDQGCFPWLLVLIGYCFEFFADAYQTHADVVDGDAEDGGDFVVGEVFEPEEDECAVEGVQFGNAFVKARGCRAPVLFGVEVHVHLQG